MSTDKSNKSLDQAVARYMQALDELKAAKAELRAIMDADADVPLSAAELPPRVRRSVQIVQQIVASSWMIPLDSLWCRERSEPVVTARLQAMAILRKLQPLSSVEIGRAFRRDHGAVLSAVRSVSNTCDVDPDYRAQFSRLLDACRAELASLQLVP